MEPWDGPAALAMTDGRWVCAGLDRNGLRPMRYVITGDGLLIAGSEVGMVPINEANCKEKGALGPGQLLAVDLAEGKLYHDEEIKNKLASAHPFGEWTAKIKELDTKLSGVQEKQLYFGEDLRKRQIAAGYTIEEIEQILVPMAEDGIRYQPRSRGLGDVYKRQLHLQSCPKDTGHYHITLGKIFPK